jgi:hypothetical protein
MVEGGHAPGGARADAAGVEVRNVEGGCRL